MAASPFDGNLTSVWRHAAEALPAGWQLDALWCTWSARSTEEAVQRWLARAFGPDGEVADVVASDPIEALAMLVGKLRSTTVDGGSSTPHAA
jgi:hypothetical protein